MEYEAVLLVQRLAKYATLNHRLKSQFIRFRYSPLDKSIAYFLALMRRIDG